MKFKTIYNSRVQTPGTLNTEPSLTLQSDEPEGNINTIMDKYARFGALPSLAPQAPEYVDLTNAPEDFMQAQTVILNAQAAFDALPSEVRREFDYNPANMLAFVQDESNYDRAVELGLVQKKVEPIIPRIVDTPEVSE